MPLPEVEHLARRYVPGDGAVEVQRLRAGLVNDTYRVQRAGQTFALRLSAPDSPDLGQDRCWEMQILDAAGRAGLAPRVAFSDPERGLLVSHWVAGEPWSAQHSATSGGIDRICRCLRRVHALIVPAPARAVSPAGWIDYYLEALASRHLPLVPASIDLQAQASLRLAQLAQFPPVGGVICHSDVHALNLIETEDRMVLLDWEYAHVTEPFWDLAGWCANNDFGEAARRDLLTEYLQRAPGAAEWLRLDVLIWLYDYICVLWMALYLSLPHGDGAAALAPRADFLCRRLAGAAWRAC